MKKIVSFIILVVLVSLSTNAQGLLKGLVVILDPGHGGKDFSAKGYFGYKRLLITESSYCFDVSLRIKKLLENEGAIVYLTVLSNSQTEPINEGIQDNILSDQNEYFAFDGSRVEKTKSGLYKRSSLSNQILKKYSKFKVIFMSIHYDNLHPNYISGIRIIKSSGKESSILSNFLIEEIIKAKLIYNTGLYLLNNGDKKHGIKNLVVLGNSNRVPIKIYLELGNINNKEDIALLKSPKGRDNYALIISRALKSFMKKVKN